jgi:hypothetical protein
VKTILFFLGKLMLFSLLVIPMIEWFDGTYQGILQAGVANPGDIPFMSSHMLYLVFALILATPRLGLRRRIIGIAAGLLLYMLADRLMIPIWKALPYTQKPGPVPAKEFYTSVYYMIMHWLLPFLLWIVIAYRQIEGMCKGQLQGETVR